MRSSSAWASRPVQNDLRALGEGRGRRPGAASDVACVCVCVCVCKWHNRKCFTCGVRDVSW